MNEEHFPSNYCEADPIIEEMPIENVVSRSNIQKRVVFGEVLVCNVILGLSREKKGVGRQ